MTQNKFHNNRSLSFNKININNIWNKSNIDSTMIRKEMEKLNLIKKQQIGEIKNIIDYEYFFV